MLAGREVSMTRVRLLLSLAVLVIAAVGAGADEGWLIERMEIRYDLQPDGSIKVADAIDVDFGRESKHGIFRDVARRQSFDDRRDRLFDVVLVGVLDARGQRHQVDIQDVGDLKRFKIGDAKRELSGKQTYRIAYQLGGALNAFADHDEFYWNATGKWPVTVEQAVIRVRVPGGGVERASCYQGPDGSTDRCDVTTTADEAVYTATRPLRPGEQMTIVTGVRKGTIAVPALRLAARPRANVLEFFEHTPVMVAGAAVEAVVCLGLVAVAWWRFGRDRRFIGVQRGPSNDAPPSAEERVPMFAGQPVGVEFQPPDRIRPAQMGLLLDERADTLDVTATIVDLAVRGHLKITEIDKAHWFNRKDWQLERLSPLPNSTPTLLPYERIVLEGLFESGSPTKLSALKNKFYDDLAKAQGALYLDAVERGWFPQNPNTVRWAWRLAGVAVAAGGVALVVWLGRWWGAGLLAVPVVLSGILVVLAARAMPRRTGLGQAITRRTLGFLKYIKTAEVQQQAFAERAHLFTEYLPYAIAFRCVDKWASAFRDIDMRAATAAWYSGPSHFNATTFSSNLGSFSSTLSTSIASTPGGSGRSGFSGGSAGSGGGGGGGGSW